MSRHANLKNIINDARQGEEGYYDEYGGQADMYHNKYGDYGDYGDEYGEEIKAMEAKAKTKKTKRNDGLGGYEEDLGSEEEEKEQIPVKPKVNKKKNKVSKVEEPEEVVVLSIADQFSDFFTVVQVRDTLIANDLDVDKSMLSLKQRHENALKKGQSQNIKKVVYDKVQKQKEEKLKAMEENLAVKEFNEKMDRNVEKDYDFFQQEDHATLNMIYPDLPVDVEIDKEEAAKDINMVIIGHVDAGKSTLMGHLLHKLGVFGSHQIKKNEKVAEQYKKATFEFAFLMDEDEEERRHGVTIHTAMHHFTTPNKNFTIIDAPGHKDFISNMISGASQAECAILVVDSHTGAFEKGFENGQTKEHAIIARSLGVTQLVIAVNKLDMVNWSKERFLYIYRNMVPFLTTVGFKEKNLTFVPISGLKGLNLDTRDTQPEELTSWYKQDWILEHADNLNHLPEIQKQPVCLIDAIERFKSPAKPYNKPTRVCVYGYYNKVRNAGDVIYGDCLSVKVESGILHENSTMILMPLNVEVKVKSIEIRNKGKYYAVSGQLCEINITFNKKELDPDYIKAGAVLSDPKYNVHQVSKIRAKIVVYDSDMPILKGTQVVVYSFSNKVPGRISSLELLLDPKTSDVLKTKPKKLIKGNFAQVVIKMESRVCMELFANNKAMGRIALRDGNETIAAGQVIELVS